MKKLKLITTEATALSIAAILAVTGFTACGSKTISESSSKKEASVDSENNMIKFAIQPGTRPYRCDGTRKNPGGDSGYDH